MSSQQLLKRVRQTLPDDISPFLVDLHREKYYQILRLHRTREFDLANPFERYLHNDYVEYIEITSDLVNPILTGHVIFSDRGNKLFQRIPTEDMRTYLEVTILKTGELVSDIKITFNHSFFITDIETLQKNHLGTDYKLHLLSGHWGQFNNYLVYSSRGEKPFTEMVEDVFRKMEIDFQSVRNTAVNILERRGMYVTAANNRGLDTVESLVAKSVNDSVGFLFLKYDHLDDRYRLMSPKIEYKEAEEDLDVDNVLNLPTAELVANVERTANNISEKNYHGENTLFDIQKGTELHYFDYDQREWKVRTFSTGTVFNDVLPTPTSRQYEVKFKPLTVQFNKEVRRENEERLLLDFAFRDKIADTFLYTDVIEFECYGVLKRGAGDMIILFSDDKHPLQKKFAGMWMITRVYHRIIRKDYVNVIQACRVHQTIEKLRINDDLQIDSGT
jgi:hypothetical protein